jgi:aspartyl-tRNA synthetase
MDEDEKKVDFAHNPFSMPQGGWRRWKRRIR